MFIKVSVTGISEYDIITGKLTVSGYQTLKWTDDILQWTTSEFSGVNRISLGADEIWFPHMKQALDMDDKYAYSAVWLTSNGTVATIVASDFVGYCDVDTVYFPLDEQTCSFSLISSSSDADGLALMMMRNDINTDSFRKHGEWDVIETNIFPIKYMELDVELEFVGVAFVMKLKRRPTFIILHFLGPLELIALLNMMIYVVPILSGERVSFAVTILLALVFFTTNISEYIPRNSLKIPIVSMVILTIMTLCSLNVIISVKFSRIATQKLKPVSGCLKSFIRMFLQTPKNSKQVRPKEADRKRLAQKKEDFSGLGDEIVPTKFGEEVEITWVMAVDVFDAIMFYVHLLVVATGIVIGTLYIMDIL